MSGKSANQQIGKSANQQIGKSANGQISKSANRKSQIADDGTRFTFHASRFTPYDVFLVGVGGQGVLTIGDLIAEAALRQGVPVSFYPT